MKRPGPFAARLALTLLSGLILAGVLMTAPLPGAHPEQTRLPGIPGVPGMAPPASFHVLGAPSGLPVDLFCASCHPFPPHRRSPVQRAMLNHHVSRLHCLVCHGGSFVRPGEAAWKEQVLVPAPGGEVLTPEREQAWRDQAKRTAPCFPAGPGCADCHRPAGSLDWRKLGYDEKNTSRLSGLDEFFLKTPAGKWFFPTL